MKIYLVGGAVRDELLGIKSNDLDYVVVLDKTKGLSPKEGFVLMENWMKEQGFEIFLSTPEMFTSRAKFPKGHKNEGIVGDFVLARKEIGYEPYSRRPIISLGTLMDDLERRDFTVNAMAKDDEGRISDPFNGLQDLGDRILRTPRPALVTFNEDSLRLLRAIRFHITKGFMLSEEIKGAMKNPEILINLRKVVSQERIREEILKMMKFDTISTIKVLSEYKLLEVCFGGKMWLQPTFKKI